MNKEEYDIKYLGKKFICRGDISTVYTFKESINAGKANITWDHGAEPWNDAENYEFGEVEMYFENKDWVYVDQGIKLLNIK